MAHTLQIVTFSGSSKGKDNKGQAIVHYYVGGKKRSATRHIERKIVEINGSKQSAWVGGNTDEAIAENDRAEMVLGQATDRVVELAEILEAIERELSEEGTGAERVKELKARKERELGFLEMATQSAMLALKHLSKVREESPRIACFK